jgi:hypothetical protein
MSKKRSIFEEVSTVESADDTFKGGYIDLGKTDARRAIAVWLLLLFFTGCLYDNCGWADPF